MRREKRWIMSRICSGFSCFFRRRGGKTRKKNSGGGKTRKKNSGGRKNLKAKRGRKLL